MTTHRQLVWLMAFAALQLPFAGLARGENATSGETVSLVTKDGVLLKISYFPGTARKGTPQSKQTTPVVFLHDYKGSRAVFAPLVQKLQAPGKVEGEPASFAVVTVDLHSWRKHQARQQFASRIECSQAEQGRPDRDGKLRFGRCTKFPCRKER